MSFLSSNYVNLASQRTPNKIVVNIEQRGSNETKSRNNRQKSSNRQSKFITFCMENVTMNNNGSNKNRLNLTSNLFLQTGTTRIVIALAQHFVQ